MPQKKERTQLASSSAIPSYLDADSPHDRLLNRFHVIGTPDAALQFALRTWP
jgi:hypothetical protein